MCVYMLIDVRTSVTVYVQHSCVFLCTVMTCVYMQLSSVHVNVYIITAALIRLLGQMFL